MAPRDGDWAHHPHDLAGAWRAIYDLRYQVDEILKADEIADAVTDKLAHSRRAVLRRWEKVLVLVFAFAAAVGTIVGDAITAHWIS